MDATLVIFAITYVGVAFGRLPGFRVDRTGSAVLGAMAVVVTGKMTGQAAWDSISFETIALLFGLMLVSAAFVVSGFYSWAAARLALLRLSPPLLLAVFVVASALMSSIVTNDVVVVAMTPLLVATTLSRGLNPVPFLLGFCFASNTGAAGTVMGSPQNIIIAQGLGVSFVGFLEVAAIPALLSLPLVWGVLVLLYRGRWRLPEPADGAAPVETPAPPAPDTWETAKALVITSVVVFAFVFTKWPREQVALGAAVLLLLNRQISSKDMLKHVDGNLLLLLFGLFVVNAALAETGLPARLLAAARLHGIDTAEPLWLFVLASALSNVVGNNPTAMLLVPTIGGDSGTAAGAAIALGTGFSSNLVIFGSLAGIIVVEAAARHGVAISFREFSRAGIPVALATSALAVLWILYLGIA